ncbi:hypothetical protein XM53_09980 [Roseovarius atlanticus]|uniref:Uncharacterized protein n=1 Tax=Roseovarius atlanticus TaxID=1641875 RepID=A0A0T5NVT5_9RHOB|nr:hypothetical protein [Roseovarius atlanticus]KRS12880.1 hypothetical protein XM53_09980 [Roseovarius atlanticus]
MNEDQVTLVNTGLPLLIIGGFAALLPWLLTPRGTRSHGRVLVAVVASAGLLLGLSAGIFALFDRRSLLGGQGLAGQGAVVWMYLRTSLAAVVVWGPVLVFTWLGLAQRVERLRNRDIVRGEA